MVVKIINFTPKNKTKKIPKISKKKNGNSNMFRCFQF